MDMKDTLLAVSGLLGGGSGGGGGGPTITLQPSDFTGALDAVATFHVEATGTGLTYKWQSNTTGSWADTSFATSTTDTVSVKITAARDGKQFRCQITDGGGNVVYSHPATLRVAADGAGDLTLLASGEYVKTTGSAGIEIPVSYSGTPVYWYYFNTTPKADTAQNYLGFTMVGDDPDLDSALLANEMYMAIADRLVKADGTGGWSGIMQVVTLANNKMSSVRPGTSGTHCAGTWKWRIYGRAGA